MKTTKKDQAQLLREAANTCDVAPELVTVSYTLRKIARCLEHGETLPSLKEFKQENGLA